MDNAFVVIRPIREDDLNIVCEFGNQSGIGFTTLVNNTSVMSHKIHQSLLSFKGEASNGSRYFFFVMEYYKHEDALPKVIGTCAIDSPQGKTAPLYNYKLVTVTQLCEKLNKYKQHKMLTLVSDYQNTAQLSTLFLQESFRGFSKGELLSRARLLFIAEFPDFFSDIIFSQIRGLLDDRDNSLFWDSLGRYFFDMDFKEANLIRSIEGEEFISDLMPTYPIYIELLSQECQKTIGEPHVDARGALRLLEKEGFKNRGYVDIFNSGPIIEAYKKEIKTITDSIGAKVHEIRKNTNKLDNHNKIIANTRLDFRATLGQIECIEPGIVCVDERLANILNVSVGDNIRFCDLHKKQ